MLSTTLAKLLVHIGAIDPCTTDSEKLIEAAQEYIKTNDNLLDLDTARKWFKYKDGKLIWIKRARKLAHIGDRAGDSNSNYRILFHQNRVYSTYDIIWIMNNGTIPKGLKAEKINKHKESTIDNLRLVESIKNLSSKNTSGYPGVSYNRASGKWVAFHYMNNKKIYLGYFITKQEAIDAKKKAEKKYNCEDWRDFDTRREVNTCSKKIKGKKCAIIVIQKEPT